MRWGCCGSRRSEGVNGDLHVRGATPHPTVVFTVDRIEDTVAVAVASGWRADRRDRADERDRAVGLHQGLRGQHHRPVRRDLGRLSGPGPRGPADNLARVSSPALTSSAPAIDPTFENVWDELVWRGLVHVSTDQDALRALLAGPPIVYYCGFDPTAPSLHLGNLVQLLVMRRLQLAGHSPLGLVGGSTGLVGDPRPSAERTLNTKETVAEWVGYLRSQIERFLSFEGENAARIVNNLDWTAPMSAIDFLRDIGKHYRVGTMLKKEAVSARLNSDEGISYTEFSYQILQGLDYRELFLQYGCVLQTGGSDQWGNLTSGVDLIHRAEGKSVHAIGTPLITNSDGRKFGKSEGNAIWLDAKLTSPYAMYQFWLNTDDADVADRLKVFTFLTRAEIDEIVSVHDAEPFRRIGQKRVAREVTAWCMGRMPPPPRSLRPRRCSDREI